MYFAVPHLARLAVFFSLYNIVTWTIDWFRFSIGYFGPTLFALLPQVALTAWLFLVARRYEVFQYRILAPIITLTLWVITHVINSWELIFSRLEVPWSRTFSILDTLGFPILEMQYGGTAPLLGLFHSNEGDTLRPSDWYLDGGIQFSWLAFNIIILLFLLFSMRIAFEDRKDGTFTTKKLI